jgi:predicted nucleic acid-binding protein
VGSLVLPTSGLVYVDTQILIYSVERHPTYSRILLPLWNAAENADIRVTSSDLSLLETLVGPIRLRNAALEARYDRLFTDGVRLLPIDHIVLRRAASMRADIPGLRTPDAIHAATAIVSGCALFLTNDAGFRRIPGLQVCILSDLAVP